MTQPHDFPAEWLQGHHHGRTSTTCEPGERHPGHTVPPTAPPWAAQCAKHSRKSATCTASPAPGCQRHQNRMLRQPRSHRCASRETCGRTKPHVAHMGCRPPHPIRTSEMCDCEKWLLKFNAPIRGEVQPGWKPDDKTNTLWEAAHEPASTV